MPTPKTPKPGLTASPAFFFFVLVAVGELVVNDVIVVVANPIPPGPTLIVWPLYTSVVALAPGPIVNVVPPILTNEGPISEKVIPPAVTA